MILRRLLPVEPADAVALQWDGLALARELRRQGFAQPLLAVTARADADAERLAREAGFDGFLRKPVTGQMLASAIESALGDFDPVQDAAT